PLVQGALYLDRNALERLARLFSSLEYVTTNGMGSHIGYAAYWGAKVSVYGTFAEMKDADYSNVDEYQSMIKAWEWARSETTMRHYYPELFCHPAEAKVPGGWARHELGHACKVAPAELRALFGWTLGARVNRNVQRVARRVSVKASDCVQALVPWRFVHQARMRRNPVYRRDYEIRS